MQLFFRLVRIISVLSVVACFASSSQAQQYKYHLKWGNKLYVERNFQGAALHYGRVIQLNPDCASGYYNRALALNELRRFNDAEADLVVANRLHRGNAKYRFALGRTRHYLDNHSRALGDFTEVIRLDPRNAKAFNYRGTAQWKMGDREAALRDYDHAIELDPTDAYFYRDRGGLLIEMKKYEEAMADCIRATRIEPDLKCTLEKCIRECDDDRLVIEGHTELIRIDPNNAMRYHRRAHTWQRLRKLDKAIADMTKAIELEDGGPGSKRHYRCRIRLWDAIGNEQRAKADRELSSHN